MYKIQGLTISEVTWKQGKRKLAVSSIIDKKIKEKKVLLRFYI